MRIHSMPNATLEVALSVRVYMRPRALTLHAAFESQSSSCRSHLVMRCCQQRATRSL